MKAKHSKALGPRTRDIGLDPHQPLVIKLCEAHPASLGVSSNMRSRCKIRVSTLAAESIFLLAPKSHVQGKAQDSHRH